MQVKTIVKGKMHYLSCHVINRHNKTVILQVIPPHAKGVRLYIVGVYHPGAVMTGHFTTNYLSKAEENFNKRINYEKSTISPKNQ